MLHIYINIYIYIYIYIYISTCPVNVVDKDKEIK